MDANFLNSKEIKRYCKKCKKYTLHTEHGFPGSNYRQACSICRSENYTRDGFWFVLSLLLINWLIIKPKKIK